MSITYPCPDCRGHLCRPCDGQGFLVAGVTSATIRIDNLCFDRGVESEERVTQALDLVDDWCRQDLEPLLRSEGTAP